MLAFADAALARFMARYLLSVHEDHRHSASQEYVPPIGTPPPRPPRALLRRGRCRRGVPRAHQPEPGYIILGALSPDV